LLKKVIIANALLILFYLIFDWAEYSLLSTYGPNSAVIDSHFPFYIQASATVNGEPYLALSFNFPLLIFLIAILVNLNFIIKLQKS